MKVLIVGSRRHLKPELVEQHHAFEGACTALGAALAARGHSVIVGTDDELDADPHVVRGLSMDGHKHIVVVSRPEADERPTPFSAQRDGPYKHLEFTLLRRGGVWASALVHALSNADALLVIGGKETTLTIGFAADALRKPVLAIQAFGGAAKDLWNEVRRSYRLSGIDEATEGELAEPWSPRTALAAVNGIEALVRRPPFQREKLHAELSLFASVLLLLGAWAALYRDPEYIGKDTTFFVQLLVAALLGTILRTTLRLAQDPSSRLDARLLLREAASGMIVGFGFALLYLAGGFVISGDFVPLAEEADYRRVTFIMSLVGLGSAVLLNEAAANLIERVRPSFESDERPRPGGTPQ